ncbi:ABC-type uncharacterized transport system substrate-binding protein [Bradyrhizobium sp. CIR48]|uniref:hypothetical protein n=1 Tax=Bradyrhizobium sp. CIR48 TaxID=2663840 RepID=UPI001605A4E3|nr:hypothetical protein [Bradyrhizobium sp. CIR48]MBB4427814.1 ABC-type uncharacterized transport system substrate-binding protein [Bradyrhizobium sp. CIR48]
MIRVSTRLDHIGGLASKACRRWINFGGLISYRHNSPRAYTSAGTHVGRIHNGEKPADLPVMQPTKFDSLTNLRTANAVGLTVPLTLLAEAGDVSE